MKIAILTHNFPENQLERKNAGIFVFDLAKELSKKNQVTVFTPGSKDTQKIVDSVKVHFFKWKGTSLGNLKLWNPSDVIKLLFFFINGEKNLNNFYQLNKPEKIIAMWAFPSGLFAYLLKKRFNISYTIWTLGSDIYIYAKKPFLSFLIKKILENSTHLIADSVDLKKETEKLANTKCYFIPSATKIDYSLKLKSKGSSKIIITFLGRVEKAKGADILIDSLHKLGPELVRFEINIIGDGKLLPILKSNSKKLINSKSVNFFGNLDDPKKIFSILSNSDWVIIPSRNDSIPLVFSEAMKVKTPVIVSDLADFKYLINKYKVGLLFKSGDSNKLFELLKNLNKNNQRYLNFKQNTLTAAKAFSIEDSAKKLLAVIKNDK